MDQPTPRPAVRRRRWASLSVRGMLILVLALGVLLGWRTRRAARQRKAVAAIEALGGEVVYDWQPRWVTQPFPPPPVVRQLPGPTWLRKLIGDEYFQEVVEVAYPTRGFEVLMRPPRPGVQEEVSPEWRAFQEAEHRRREIEEARERDQLACLEGLDRIEALNLQLNPLKPEAFARLGKLTSLRNFQTNLFSTDAEGLAQITHLTNLEKLAVTLSLADAAPLAQLERLTALKELSVCKAEPEVDYEAEPPRLIVKPTDGPITDAWLARLGRLRSLTYLFLNDGSQITDAGLAHLAGLSQLEGLSPGGFDRSTGLIRITDSGLAPLTKLQKLKSLDLGTAPEIGDAGLAHLGKLPHLDRLFLSSAAKITDAGVAHLEGLREMDWLRLDAADKLTEASVDSLAKLPLLRALFLNVKSIPQSALAHLATFKSLKFLTLTGAKVRGGVIDALMTANPGLEIEAERNDDDADAMAPGPDGPGSVPPSVRVPE